MYYLQKISHTPILNVDEIPTTFVKKAPLSKISFAGVNFLIRSHTNQKQLWFVLYLQNLWAESSIQTKFNVFCKEKHFSGINMLKGRGQFYLELVFQDRYGGLGTQTWVLVVWQRYMDRSIAFCMYFQNINVPTVFAHNRHIYRSTKLLQNSREKIFLVKISKILTF